MSTQTSSRRYLLRETVLLLGFVYLIFFGGTGGGLQGKTTLIITSLLLTLFALCWVLRGPAPAHPLRWPIALFLAVLLAAALLGIDPARSLPEVWLIGVEFFLLLLVSALVARGWPPELFVKTLLLSGGVLSLFSWVGVIQWYRGWLAASPGQWIPSASFRLPAANMLAVLLNLLLMAALARLLATRRRPAQVLLGLYALSTLALLYLTSSRSGWLGTAAGLGTLALLHLGFLRVWGRKALSFLNRRRWLWLPLALIALAVLAAGGALLYRQALHPTHSSILTARAGFWPPAWEAFRSSPWLGTGPFTFASYFVQANSVPPSLLFVYAHNIYLDVLHGSGLIGFAAFALLGILMLRALDRARRAAVDPAVRAVVIAAMAGLAAFGVHGVFDSVHHTEPLCAMTLAILLGAALGREPSTKRTRIHESAAGSVHIRSRADSGASVAAEEKIRAHPRSSASYSKLLPLTVSLFLRVSASLLLPLLLIAFAWYRLWILWPFYGAAQAADSGDWSAAVSGYQESARRGPRLAPAYNGLGLSLFMAGEETAALEALEKTVVLDPYYALHWANLAEARLQNGDPAGALAAMETAVEKAPRAAVLRLQLGALAARVGVSDLAAEAYAEAAALDPRLVGYYLLKQPDPLLESVLDDAQRGGEQPTLADLQAAVSASPSSPAPYLALADALLDGGDLPGAATVLTQAHFAYYGSTLDYMELLALEARLAAAQGESDRAADLQAQVEGALAGWGPYGPGSYGLRLYAPYAYRVPGMKLEWLLSSGVK